MSVYGGDTTIGTQARDTSNAANATSATDEAAINSAFAGFNDKFYGAKRQAYLNQALPELNKQYGTERKSLVYGLANRGLLKSGAANEQFTNLAEALTSKRQDVVNSAITTEQNFKTQIATAKNTLLSQIGTSTSPSTTAQNALSTAAGFTTPGYTGVSSNAFSDFNTALSNRYALSNLGSSALTSSGTTTYTGTSSSANNDVSNNNNAAAAYTVA